MPPSSIASIAATRWSGAILGASFAVIVAVLAFVTPARAQLYADVSTTMGDFTLEMFYKDSPKTVANFVSLAEGSRRWIDPATGEVRENTPYFNGIIFHRVIDGFMNQVGSPQGTGSDGPGYVFCDEVTNGLIHDEAYLLSSANSGPHTNGSQLFITVVETPWLDGIHTVFGKVASGTDVIDAINNAPTIASRPVDEISITSISIRRVGAEAIAFDVTDQGLPEVEQLPLDIENSAGGLKLLADQPAGTSLGVFRTLDLLSWTGEFRHISPLAPPLSEYGISGDEPRAFFRTPLVHWPAEASFPSNLESWVLSIVDPVNGIEFEIRLAEPPTLIFQEDEYLIDMERSRFDSDGYGCSIFLATDELVSFRFRLGADIPIGGAPSGRMTGTAFTLSPTTLNGSFSMAPAP